MDRVTIHDDFDWKKVKTVYVEWVDHASMQGWTDISELQDSTALQKCHTIGFLVKDTDEEIVVTTTLSEQGGATDPLTIHKKVISHLQVLPRRRNNTIKPIDTHAIVRADRKEGDSDSC